jgi:hypothetical protein
MPFGGWLRCSVGRIISTIRRKADLDVGDWVANEVGDEEDDMEWCLLRRVTLAVKGAALDVLRPRF